jgi:hypothetical protein
MIMRTHLSRDAQKNTNRCTGFICLKVAIQPQSKFPLYYMC